MKKTVRGVVITTLVVAVVVAAAYFFIKSEEEVVTPEPVQVVEKVYYNFLTGEKKDSKRTPRPVAVTVNNIEASLPQYGISDADIIMEFPAEGGITRLMALYSDYAKMPDICSIRSCRYYFPVFAKGFGAAYFCFGSNETLATPMLQKLGIDYIDGNKTGDTLVFERDGERLQNYSLEHTAYLKGTNMKEIFKKYNFSTKLSSKYGDTAFNFSQKTLTFKSICKEITAGFSTQYKSRFTYDESSKTYLKEHNGEKHMDSRSEKQLAFDNVIILETQVQNYNGTVLVEIDWKGGTGYYATNGTVRKILWEKKTEDSPIKLYNLDKKPIKINTGKSYIAVGTAEVTVSEAVTVQ